MAPVNGGDINRVRLSNAESHTEAVNDVCRTFGVEQDDIYAVFRLGITTGQYRDADTVAIVHQAKPNHVFEISPTLTTSIEQISTLLNTPVERLRLFSYESNNGAITTNTVVIEEIGPNGDKSLRFIDLYDRFESASSDTSQNTLFHSHTSRAQYLGSNIIACHHEIIISDTGKIDNLEGHTLGADSSQRFDGSVSLWGEVTPNLSKNTNSQAAVYEFTAKFAIIESAE